MLKANDVTDGEHQRSPRWSDFGRRLRGLSWFAAALALVAAAGCGSTKSQRATEQLLLSDAVDRAVASIDFRPLAGKTVYLDTQYLGAIEGIGFVNAPYIISSVRQQMIAARCQLQTSRESAEYVVEIRVGTLAANQHEITYGLPASQAISAAASLIPNSPPLPVIPEISLAKRQDQQGAAKIGVFAYHRETSEPYWQSGLSESRSSARDTWLMGAGPFQVGTIHERPRLAGQRLELRPPWSRRDRVVDEAVESYRSEVLFAAAREEHEAADSLADDGEDAADTESSDDDVRTAAYEENSNEEEDQQP